MDDALSLLWAAGGQQGGRVWDGTSEKPHNPPTLAAAPWEPHRFLWPIF